MTLGCHGLIRQNKKSNKEFLHIHQRYFSVTGAIMQLSQSQPSNPAEYLHGWCWLVLKQNKTQQSWSATCTYFLGCIVHHQSTTTIIFYSYKSTSLKLFWPLTQNSLHKKAISNSTLHWTLTDGAFLWEILWRLQINIDYRSSLHSDEYIMAKLCTIWQQHLQYS